MTVRSVRGGPSSKFDLGDKVMTPSGFIGEIIGLAEFGWYWEYRIRVPGKKQTMYRREDKLTRIMKGSKARREYWTSQGLKMTRKKRS